MRDNTSPARRNYPLPLLAICYLAFVSLGLPDPLIGVAWPSVRETFHLQQSQVSWVFAGNGCSYFLSSFFAGRLLKIFNVGLLLAVSSALVGLSMLNYGVANVWPWFALGSLLHGLGSGAIDSGLNHYVATHFSARHMNWLHASYSLGAMLGPAIMTACIARAGHWRLAYLIVAGALTALALLFFLTHLRWRDPIQHNEPRPPASAAQPGVPIEDTLGSSRSSSSKESIPLTTTAALRNRIVQLSIVTFFIYTGLEVALGQWSFTILTESRRIAAETAGIWVTLYWAAILAGRIIFGFIVDRIRIDLLIRLSLATALLGTALFAWCPFPASAPIALALCGLGLAVIFPCLMTRTPQRLGKDLAAHAIGLQVGGAMLGAGMLPSVCGLIAQHSGLHTVAILILFVAVALFLLHETLILSIKLTPKKGYRDSA